MSPSSESRVVWLLVLLSTACSADMPVRCGLGETVGCSCGGASTGIQTCDEAGRYGACVCDAIPRCVPGSLFSCSCEDGASGAQACDATGMFGSCVCGAIAPTCVPGASAACRCTDGSEGAQSCTAEGYFEPCICDPPRPETCVPGLVRDCTCRPGYPSTQTCTPEGAFEACSCGYLDAGPGPDVGDASTEFPSCNPYLGEVCGCPELTPPSDPTLSAAPGTLTDAPGTLVDVFVREAGVLLVLRGGVRMLARDGTLLFSWDSPRPISEAAADLERLVVADAAGFISLDASLMPSAPVFTPTPCGSLALLSCGRLACSTGTAVLTYDLTTTALLASSALRSERLVRVPGVEGVIEAGFSQTRFLRLDPDGTFVATGVQFLGGGSTAFIGRPATHAVLPGGELLRLADCMFARPLEVDAVCLGRDGTLGTTGPDERIFSVATGIGASIDALVGPPFGRGCGGPCTLERIDVERRLVVSRRSLAGGPLRGAGVILRDDPWSGAVVLATPNGCNSAGTVCASVLVELVRYD